MFNAFDNIQKSFFIYQDIKNDWWTIVISISRNNLNTINKPQWIWSSFFVLFVWFDSLRPLNNLSVMRDVSSWVEPVLS